MSGMALFLVWIVLEFTSIRMAVGVDAKLFYGTRHGVWFLLGPLLYLYCKSLTDQNFRFKHQHIFHFIPFFLFTFLIPSIIQEPVHDWAVHYGILKFFTTDLPGLTPIQHIYNIVFILQFFHAVLYLFLSLSIVKGYSKSIKNVVSNIDKINLAWLKYLITGFMLLIILLGLFLAVLLHTEYYRRELDYVYIIPISVFIFITAFKAMATPEVYAVVLLPYINEKRNKKYENLLLPQK